MTSGPKEIAERLTKAPKRIQLSRAKGWRMPANTVKVDRSTKWGNPWPIGKEGPFGRAGDAVGACYFFEEMFRDPELRAAAEYPADLSPLRGKDLACWCALGSPCHADVLLKLANATDLGRPVAKLLESYNGL